MSTDHSPPGQPVDPFAPFSYDIAVGGAVPPGALAYDSLTASVLDELERAQQLRSWLQSILLLGFTFVLFAATRAFNTTPANLLLLVAVLLFHEMGHYVGMRTFNYQDVRMFFIPLFGAAVSGRSTSVQGYKEAIVLLLGPLPGIVLGCLVGIACLFRDIEILRSAALLLLVLNGFNLLPFLPLDGGRVLHLVVFSRQPHLEAAFRVVTGLLLAACGFGLGAWMLAIIGVFVVFATGHTFRVSRLARQLRGPSHPGEEMDLSARIPRDQAIPLIERVRQVFPNLKLAKPLANTVRQVWERMHLQPPGLMASLAILALYVGSLVGTPLVAALFQIPIRSTVSRPNPDGTLTRVREVRTWGRLRKTSELDANDRLNGKHVEYSPLTGRIRVTGSYSGGQQDGEWKTFDDNGQLQSQETFDHGLRDLPR